MQPFFHRIEELHHIIKHEGDCELLARIRALRTARVLLPWAPAQNCRLRHRECGLRRRRWIEPKVLKKASNQSTKRFRKTRE